MLRFSHACSRTLLTASCLIASGHGFAQTGSIVSPTYTAGSAVTIQPGADSTSAVQIANHAGTPVASVDTTNNRVIVGSGLPSNALVVGMEATASTLVPASTIEIGNTGANSVLTLGQSASARLSMAWNYTGQSGTITTQGVQPLNLQSNGGPVVLGGGFATKRVVTAVSYTATSGDCIIGFSAVPSGASVTLPSAGTVAAGQQLIIKDESGNASASNPITITPYTGQKINSATSGSLAAAYSAVRLYSDGSSTWYTW